MNNIKYKEIKFNLDKEEKFNEEILIELFKEIESLKKENKLVIGNKKLFSCIKYTKHPCYLVLVDSNNKNNIYISLWLGV